MLLQPVRSLLAVVFFLGISSMGVAQQTVFLDFSGTDGSITYTTAMKDDIQTLFDTYYADFDFTFTQSTPGTGPFSTITFNSGGTGGLASKIDFRNVDKNDTAVVNIDGMGFSTTADLVSASANVGARVLGNLQGLRNGDSMGPIGFGIAPSVAAGDYTPTYPGPSTAHVEDHIMATPGSVGSSMSDLTTPSFFTDRSYVKLEFNETGTTFAEAAGSKDTLATAQAVTFETLTALNTTKFPGHDALDPEIRFAAFAVVDAEISAGAELDLYEFEITEADVARSSILNFELMSTILVNRFPMGTFDTKIAIWDSTGTEGSFYYGTSAFNSNDFQSTDSIMIDLLASEMGAGTFYIAVTDQMGTSTGSYELFGHKTFAVPEPSSLAVIGMFGGYLALRRRRRIGSN